MLDLAVRLTAEVDRTECRNLETDRLQAEVPRSRPRFDPTRDKHNQNLFADTDKHTTKFTTVSFVTQTKHFPPTSSPQQKRSTFLCKQFISASLTASCLKRVVVLPFAASVCYELLGVGYQTVRAGLVPVAGSWSVLV